jgi:hypothetical protein
VKVIFFTDKARKELKQLDMSFDEQESTAISIPQSDVLLSLSAIYMDPGKYTYMFMYVHKFMNRIEIRQQIYLIINIFTSVNMFIYTCTSVYVYIYLYINIHTHRLINAS